MAKVSPSALGRLLEEISWEGNARRYRAGGQGYENVLTAEVLQALDFLPRATFLGRILESIAEPGTSEAVRMLIKEAEETQFSLLPGGVTLETALSVKSPVEVQPDALLESPNVYCLVEAKRIRPASFQPEQLAREYLCVVQQARQTKKTPLMILILSDGPKVPVQGLGRISVQDAVSLHLASVLRRTSEPTASEELIANLVNVVAYVTWNGIAAALTSGQNGLTVSDQSLKASIDRLVDSARGAIKWHGRPPQPLNKRMQPRRSVPIAALSKKCAEQFSRSEEER